MSEIKELLDQFDPEDVRKALLRALRADDGAKLRSLLERLRNDSDPEARALYERLVNNPDLHDLVPH